MASLFNATPGAGNLPEILIQWFGRSDTFDGLQRAPNGAIIPPPPEAINALLQALAAGQLVPASPQGEQMARSYGYSPAVPQDPNFFANQPGASWADLTFGQIPGTPANTQATVEMRRLLQEALKADEAARLARYTAEQAVRMGDERLALEKVQEANDFALQSRTLDQQAAQFAQTFGLQQQEQQFRQELATDQQLLEREKFGFEQDKYTTELASAPQNLIQSALWQGNRNAAFTPQATAFGGTANTATAAGPGGVASQAQTQVPYAAVVNALRTGQDVPRTGLANTQGFMTTLQDLQQDPNLRVQSNVDLPSLRNVLANPTDSAFLESTLRAQGQDPSRIVGQAEAAMPKQKVQLSRAY